MENNIRSLHTRSCRLVEFFFGSYYFTKRRGELTEYMRRGRNFVSGRGSGASILLGHGESERRWCRRPTASIVLTQSINMPSSLPRINQLPSILNTAFQAQPSGHHAGAVVIRAAALRKHFVMQLAGVLPPPVLHEKPAQVVADLQFRGSGSAPCSSLILTDIL